MKPVLMEGAYALFQVLCFGIGAKVLIALAHRVAS